MVEGHRQSRHGGPAGSPIRSITALNTINANVRRPCDLRSITRVAFVASNRWRGSIRANVITRRGNATCHDSTAAGVVVAIRADFLYRNGSTPLFEQETVRGIACPIDTTENHPSEHARTQALEGANDRVKI